MFDASTDGDAMTPASSDVPASSLATADPEEEASTTNDMAMETGDEEEDTVIPRVEGEEYRCESCNATFHSLNEFMDHRNFDCNAGTGKLNLLMVKSYFILKLCNL